MDVSENRGTPKSSILIGFSIIFTIHFGGFPPIFGITQIGGIWPNHAIWSILFPFQQATSKAVWGRYDLEESQINAFQHKRPFKDLGANLPQKTSKT